MTRKEAIHDLEAIKDYFETESDAAPTCLEFAINYLKADEELLPFQEEGGDAE